MKRMFIDANGNIDMYYIMKRVDNNILFKLKTNKLCKMDFSGEYKNESKVTRTILEMTCNSDLIPIIQTIMRSITKSLSYLDHENAFIKHLAQIRLDYKKEIKGSII